MRTLFAAALAACSPSSLSGSGVPLPAPDDWTAHGIVVPRGAPGSWDVRLGGAISPASVVEKDGRVLLYYVGASGDRRDGGPAFRKLGVAHCELAGDCADPAGWRKFEGNPVIAHEIPAGCDEAGVFSAAAFREAGGPVLLYFGGMQEGVGCDTQVDGDAVLARSDDGLAFAWDAEAPVLSSADPGLWGHGDEIFPVGAGRIGATYVLFYVAKGIGADWDLGIAWGASPERVGEGRASRPFLRDHLRIGGAHLVPWSPDTPLLFLIEDFARYRIGVRALRADDFRRPGPELQAYDFPDQHHAAVFLDERRGRWLLFYNDDPQYGDIRLRSAPVRRAPAREALPPTP